MLEFVTNTLGIRTRAYLSDGGVDIMLNAVENLTESAISEVTSHAIQEGADITDNVNPRSKDYNINAILTDNDLDILNPLSFVNYTISERLEILDLWRELKSTLIYYGQDGDLENLQLSSITKNKTLETGEGLGLQISLKEINVATAETVEVGETGKLNTPTKKGNTPKGTGSNSGTPTNKKNTSILKGIFG